MLQLLSYLSFLTSSEKYFFIGIVVLLIALFLFRFVFKWIKRAAFFVILIIVAIVASVRFSQDVEKYVPTEIQRLWAQLRE